MSNGDARLGELLLRSQLISQAQLERAKTEQRKTGGRLAGQLATLGYIKESELTNFLSKQFGVPSVQLDEIGDISPEILDLVPQDVATRHMCLPINRAGQSLIVAMADPMNIFAIDDLKFLTGYNIEVVVASEAAIKRAIERYYQSAQDDLSYNDYLDDFQAEDISFGEEDQDVDVVDLQNAAEEAPVVRLVNALLLDAIRRKASDIHIEAYERSMRVRYRIDGVLHEVMTPPIKLRNALTSRIKIMANLDIAERRLPQDGRIKLRIGRGKEMDFRVSVLPCLFGEKVVLRLLDKSNLQLDMTKLGFDPEPLAAFKEAIHKPFGMVLVTGPTGSGKTTTLYSALSELNKITENISTAEDPVEFNLHGINQVQIHDSIGLNFAAALRSFLRQDPDIIMVGEIRDFETAEIAVKSALTGHLVLSTLHTNDAPSTISRLLNMGIEPFLVTASVNLILAQRLARRLCNECKREAKVEVQVLRDLQVPEDLIGSAPIFEPVGCSNCSNTGYRGRVALYEVMVCDDEVKQYVLQGYSTAELKREAIRIGMKSLRMAGILKLLEGMTSIPELLRTTMPD
ncbi:MAG: type IV-A pilus assembly ATPase PilB [Myxococcota bacterium]|jgi:type IV pilus assembly protein PilB|nr:type IV-A pilus assembly ATPase PilB [Myxococcota bacterium]